MEQFSTSKVTVECFDPHDVYKLAAPSLISRLPLRNLHWQSHAGHLRSIETLHVELIRSGEDIDFNKSDPALRRSASISTNQDGFQPQAVAGGPAVSTENFESSSNTSIQPQSKARRHQIPGLRRTPYLKVLFVRCDDSDSYKSQVRSEIREWIKKNTTPQSSSKKGSFEGHDAFEWLIVHVVLPNTVAATQPRTSGKGLDASESKSSSRWRGGSSTLLEKLQADFNVAGKNAVDRVAQVRIGINDVPYDMLPRVVPAVPSGYVETEQDVETAWQDMIGKLKARILNSFDMRVTRYEEDIKEKDAQRILPGWNFCTFFILKEGLARGFESVGLVEDALVGYDELSVGLDLVIAEQATSGEPESHGGALLPYTDDLKAAVEKALAALHPGASNATIEEAELGGDGFEDIPIMASKKPYRDMILANNVSLFDFKCYIFARQISLLLRLGNAYSTREELVAKLNEQREAALRGVDPRIPPATKNMEETENLLRLSEVCRRTLEFIPVASQIMQQDIIAAMQSTQSGEEATESKRLPPSLSALVDHMVASFGFSVAQQVLAQTATKALPIPPSTLATPDAHEPKLSIPEPKTMMHPARTSSLNMPPGSRPPLSPNVFPGPGRSSSVSETESAGTAHFLKAGLEELAARRAELYSLCRNILEKLGRVKGWRDGWSEVPRLPDSIDYSRMEDVSLDDDDGASQSESSEESSPGSDNLVSFSVLRDRLLSTAFLTKDDFYRLYETLTDKALRHYTVANHTQSIHSCLADLAVLKYQAGEFPDAAIYFRRATPFFGENGWRLLELSMLIMYCRCLKKLGRKEELVQAILKLLMGAAAARSEYTKQTTLMNLSTGHPDLSAINGFVAELLAASTALPEQVVIPLSNFFLDIDLCGNPVYIDGSDSFSIDIELRSLLQDDLPVQRATLRLACVDGGPTKEIQLESAGKQVVKPTKSRLTFIGKAVATGRYKVDQLVLGNGKLVLSYERNVNQILPAGESIFRNPPILIFPQTRSLDLKLTAAKHTRLDQNNSLEIEISTGWNALTSCELAIKPATGGLRTITAEAKVLTTDIAFAKPPEAGMFFFNGLAPETQVVVGVPFSVEQDVGLVSVRLEATYTTADGVFKCIKLASVPIALALGVNVQDVFKHHALYSRFTVSTASTSPLRVFKSELVDSEIFESHFGVPPAAPVLVFPKQPATLLYKITRKNTKVDSKTKTTMYLKLHYSELREEVEMLLTSSVLQALGRSDIGRFARLLIPILVKHAHHKITAHDLERVSLTGCVSTEFLSGIDWRQELQGLDLPGSGPNSSIAGIVNFFEAWQKTNKRLTLEAPTDASSARSLLIPVDIPPVPVLVTADIKLTPELPFLPQQEYDGLPTACINQLIPSVLHLRWTRIWDTAAPTKGASGLAAREVSFEVTAPSETWLIGGRRRGHIQIPAGEESSPEPLQMPLMLSPLREGLLPYPAVDIREVRAETSANGDQTYLSSHCETDFKNLGEVVRVVADRARVTLSLDSSGPGGGPLVLESERAGRDMRVLA
ncbi:hypothetical protein jhhlp_007015 [Lomentospora prolificans]|uniref:Trafficking protein particle complex subunit 11 domain-containing protein n=1 Tax=Lomentospora prolificans TaxID=41688 RepID=A0A2N3N1F6_9PEZI|nr:hypothetical protein jhhlp_007015 [Lomentospora prolificans]